VLGGLSPAQDKQYNSLRQHRKYSMIQFTVVDVLGGLSPAQDKQHRTVQSSPVQYDTVQNSTVQWMFVQVCQPDEISIAVQCSKVQYSSVHSVRRGMCTFMWRHVSRKEQYSTVQIAVQYSSSSSTVQYSTE